MIHRCDNGKTEFVFHRPQAREVYLVGDFDDGGQDRSLLMLRAGNGDWVCQLDLPEGVYRFRYKADDQWYLDDEMGDMAEAPTKQRSVLVVGRTKRPTSSFP